MEFRTIQEADYKTVCSFPRDAREAFYFTPSLRYPLKSRDFGWNLRNRLAPTVALDQSRVVGFANYYDFTIGQRGFIGSVIIKPKARGRGIGRSLVAHMLDVGFQEYHFREVHISCFSENIKALLLYSAMGFEPYSIEKRRGRYDKPVALVHLKRRCSSIEGDL